MNKLTIAAGALAAFYFLKPKDEKTALENTQITLSETPALVTGLNGRFNAPNRKAWSAAYKELYLQDGEPTASEQIWQEFSQREDNPYRNYFPTKESLIFNLASYRPQIVSSIGTVTITADSAPVYDTWSNWWNGLNIWTCQNWQTWYTLNKQQYGKAAAVQKFVDAWQYSDNWDYIFLSAAGNTCGYTCDFINFFRTEGVDVANFGAQTTCNLVAIPTNLIDATATASEAIQKTATLTSQILPVVIVGAGAYWIYKKVK